MNFDPLHIEKLAQTLRSPLPGPEAHLHMAPPMFRKFAEQMKVPPSARTAAVLLLLYPHENRLYIPFMRRTQDGRVHGGQISFPGGRVEQEDKDLTHTALREAEEEIGVPAREVEILGSLSELYIVPSNFVVHPRVAFLDHRPEFFPSEEEVDEIIEVEVDILLRPETRQLMSKKFTNGKILETPAYVVREDVTIWGGTSMMLAEFLKVFKNIY